MSDTVKIVVFVPVAHADVVREAMGNAGAGKMGNYTFCFFSTKGTGQFKPEEGAHPAIGVIGNVERVEEERIETVCERSNLQQVIAAIKEVHPYEEIPIDVYALESTK